MDTSFEERIVELENKNNYFILKQLINDNTIYLLANLLVDEETPSEDFSILKVINKDGELRIALEDDEQKLEMLLKRFSEML